MTVRVSNGKGRLCDTDGRVVATIAYRIWRKPAVEDAEELWGGRFVLDHSIGESGEYILELEDGRKVTCLAEMSKAQEVPGLLTYYYYNLKGVGSLTQ